jgi:hypothetical protein
MRRSRLIAYEQRREHMRKLIILGASLMALAIPAAAIAGVAIDSAGKGFVGKGDVQTALG